MTAEEAYALVGAVDLDDRPPRLWTVAELARAGRVSEWLVRQSIRRGDLVAVRRGRLLRIADREARRFLGC